MNKGLDLLLQGEAVFYVMLMFLIEVAILYEVLFTPLYHLSGLVNNILILFFYQNLSLGIIQ